MYETDDHIIPYKMFQLRYREMWHGYAAERLNMAKAINLGIGWVMAGDKPTFKRLLREEENQAEGR